MTTATLYPALVTLHCPDCRAVHVRAAHPHDTRQVFAVLCTCGVQWDVLRATDGAVDTNQWQRVATHPQYRTAKTPKETQQ